MKTSPYSDLPAHCFWTRSISEVAASAVDPVVSAPFRLGRQDKVATAGSCFAQHIARYLKSAGFNFLVTEPAHPLLLPEEAFDYNYGTFTARYGNVYTARQLLQLYQRAYGLFQPAEDIWERGDRLIDPFRPRIQPGGFATREEFTGDRIRHFAAVRAAFEDLDVFVFTLGLTEGWEAIADGAVFPLSPGVAGGQFDPDRHRLRNFSVAEVTDDVLAFVDLLRSVNPQARVLLTVSPVPLMATARADQHVLAATTYSKSVLRVACEEILGRRTGIAYVPSYEIITGGYSRGQYFAADCRSVNESGVAHVMDVFFRHYTVGGRDLDRPKPASAGPTDAHQAIMQELVAVNCDEVALLAAGSGSPSPRCCNLCGGTDFGPGPNGRTTITGANPHCRGCESLERGRAVASVFQRLPPGHLDRWRALLVGRDQGVDPAWFKQSTTCALPVSLDYLRRQDDGSFDLITMIYGFEYLPDDVAAFDQLLRLLSPSGVMQVCFMDPRVRDVTTPLSGQPYRLYGLDLADRFGCREKAVATMTVEATDPWTQASLTTHLFARHESSLGVFRPAR